MTGPQLSPARKSGRRRSREFALQGLYQWQLAGGTDIVGGNGVGIASQRYCKVNVITDRSSTVVDLKTDDTGSATSYGYFTVTESLCAKRFGMKKET